MKSDAICPRRPWRGKKNERGVLTDKIQIDLLDQYWIDRDEHNQSDYCSHGDIYLSINENEVINKESGSWTVASAALRLMKSALYGYNSCSDLPIISCCGYLLNFGCPNIITWDAEIVGNSIKISNIEVGEIKYGGHIFSKDKFIIDLKEYRDQVMSFARKVKRFYSKNKPRAFADEYYKEEYQEYWRQFELRYSALKNEKTSD